MMNDQQLLRYSRHILLPQLDIDGQQALLDAHVMIIGLGGLGCPVLQYLAASGVGRLSLVDDDRVELSNLQRQTAHGSADIGLLKAESAAAEVQRLNPEVQVITHAVRADADWLAMHLAGVDLVVDCTDNSRVRYELNRACIARSVPWVSGAAVGLNGQITLFDPRQADAPCYRCLYPSLDNQQLSCAESGVLSPLVGIIGAMQALEALKVLAGIGESLSGRLLTFDALQGEWRRWGISRNPSCSDCQN
ncbi:HesA/MoeB/ThiF family protein [Thalassolituus hydrocarboniclasticus]|uniref:Molybdopterin-synthase adenylyltransferase MoeB n=1 Tax=Thalassolituus hydrocarboniclasticus TaxID=2742796 RepID=A0ABY6A8A9_9GAMM|nr:molybdopterin-synthase adenylyltransferase MoeB [Thalassolituus hydrocarboniclasticus]UXD86825.1 molybdopterin-synthase adenylyltransferase MoeB [Thalassolituus hydrocarboniclasticus]